MQVERMPACVKITSGAVTRRNISIEKRETSSNAAAGYAKL